MFLKIFFVFLCCVSVNCVYEGDQCSKDGAAGVCKNIRNCQTAIEDIMKGRKPQICSFDNNDPVVCCLERSATVAPPVATTTKRSLKTTTEYVPPVYDYSSNDPSGACEPVPLSLTAKKTGQKAWDKCIEYQEKLVYPCERGVALTGEMTRVKHCYHSAEDLIVGGTDAGANEFPHMALLGFGDEASGIQWVCGGALISERFVLTAAHCVYSRQFGNVSYAYVGALTRSEVEAGTQRFSVRRAHAHPQYSPPGKYHDIAVLELDRDVPLSQFIVPACLSVGDTTHDQRASATGWGLTTYKGSTSDVLQKVVLTKFSTLECAAKFPAERHMKNGFDETTQMCYGDKTKSKDTCQGDSGGPLQIYSKQIDCMYLLVGVTSFGRACGFKGEPGVYTRVQHYLPWIESLVWP